MTIQELEASIVKCVRANIPRGLRRIFLFGSRAAASNKNPRADVDIGIITDHPITFDLMARLRDATEEIPTLLKIDIVDFTERNDTFTREATQCMRVLYEGSETNQTIS